MVRNDYGEIDRHLKVWSGEQIGRSLTYRKPKPSEQSTICNIF